jgi:UDP-glucose 4-epimerase
VVEFPAMQFKKALVTGGAGFIGSHLVDELIRRGLAVVVYDNLSSGRTDYIEESKGAGKVEVVRGDVLDLVALQNAMAGCDFVFHFQANADVRGGKEKTRIDLEQNTIATWNVLDAMRICGIKSIAFASSATVYGEPDVFPTPENYAPLQTSLYGASKYAGEAMIQAYCEYYGMRSFMFRFVSWIGERYSHGVVFDFMKKLRADPSRLQILGDGSQKKSYLYVKDGVTGIMLAIEKSAGNKNIYNLGHDDFMNVVDLAKIVFDELGLQNVKLEFTGGARGWLGDSPLVHLDTSRIKALGWKAQTSIEEGIRRTARYLKDRPEILEQRK